MTDEYFEPDALQQHDAIRTDAEEGFLSAALTPIVTTPLPALAASPDVSSSQEKELSTAPTYFAFVAASVGAQSPLTQPLQLEITAIPPSVGPVPYTIAFSPSNPLIMPTGYVSTDKALFFIRVTSSQQVFIKVRATVANTNTSVETTIAVSQVRF